MAATWRRSSRYGIPNRLHRIQKLSHIRQQGRKVFENAWTARAPVAESVSRPLRLRARRSDCEPRVKEREHERSLIVRKREQRSALIASTVVPDGKRHHLSGDCPTCGSMPPICASARTAGPCRYPEPIRLTTYCRSSIILLCSRAACLSSSMSQQGDGSSIDRATRPSALATDCVAAGSN